VVEQNQRRLVALGGGGGGGCVRVESLAPPGDSVAPVAQIDAGDQRRLEARVRSQPCRLGAQRIGRGVRRRLQDDRPVSGRKRRTQRPGKRDPRRQQDEGDRGCRSAPAGAPLEASPDGSRGGGGEVASVSRNK
jgi:hypothetical protein